MKWSDFAAFWMAEVGTVPPKEARTIWQNWIEDQNSDAVMKQAIESVATRYLTAKERDGYTPAPTLHQLKTAYFDAAIGARKAAEAQRPDCPFCRSKNRVVFVLDAIGVDRKEWPLDPDNFTGGTRYVTAVPCPECCVEQYGSREAMRQRVRKFCVREEDRERLYATPKSAGVTA